MDDIKPIKFMRNRKTGVVFAWNEQLAKYGGQDLEVISPEEALEILTDNLKKKAQLQCRRGHQASARAEAEALGAKATGSR